MTRKERKLQHYKIRSLRSWLTVLVAFSFMSSELSAQICDTTGIIQTDTLQIEIDLDQCEVTSADVLKSIGIEDCDAVQLIPRGPYQVGTEETIAVFDNDRESILLNTILQVNAAPLLGKPGVSQNESGEYLIEIPMSPGECVANKDLLLDQLGVVSEELQRANIQLLSGTSRIEEFRIGDTVKLDNIACESSLFYSDVSVLFQPTASTFSNVMTFDIGVTSCEVTIEDILERLGYADTQCPYERLTISESGPFAYGAKRIDYIKIDDFEILKDAVIQVVPGVCAQGNVDLGPLEQGKCALNENDIIEAIGLDEDECRPGLISFEPAGPYISSPVVINKILVDGYEACSTPFEVIFQRDSTTQDNETLICLQDLNVAMGPECSIMLNADLILSNDNYCFLNYNIELYRADDDQTIIDSGHEVYVTEPGRYSLTIMNPTTGNSCWSEFQVEDKYIEDIRCAPDTLWCFDSFDLVPDDTIGGGPSFPDLGENTSYELVDDRTYKITSPLLCDIKNATYEDDVVSDCSDGYKEIIDRLWTFSDDFGNTDTCTQRLYVKNTTLDLIDPFVILERSCLGEFETLDANGNPSPEVSGYPTIRGNYKAGVCGTLKMTYNDTELSLCGLGKKISREWVIIDWCSDQVIEMRQTIRIEDKDAPILLDSLEDMSIESDPFICGGTNIDLPLPAFQDCNIDEVILEVVYETFNENGVLVKKSNGASLFIDEILTNSQIESSFNIEYILRDPCGNEARDTLVLTITDTQAPVAVCDEFTIISVGGNGQALVDAATFDDLSVDNCGIQKFEVRKLTGYCDLEEGFKENIRFCCEEVGDTILVEFKVIDLAGNENLCEVRVSVQDKFRPIIDCPDDIVLDCGIDYLDLDITGRPEVRDNCDLLDITYVDDNRINQCYQGSITRTWTVRDKGGFTVSCEQEIIIREDTLFSMRDAMFPKDTVIMGCFSEISPEFTGAPIINTSSCAMIDATYEDLFFEDAENACVKVLREWTVIDWCQRNGSNTGVWKKDQIIKIISDIGPEFTSGLQDTSYCIVNELCAQEITISAAAIDGDACTQEQDLVWKHDVYTSTGNFVSTGEGHTFTLNLESGAYYVVYNVVDGCGNPAIDTARFSVVDCTPPILTCPSVQPSLVLDENAFASLSISDIVDIDASDNCTNTNQLNYSFDRDSIVVLRTFNCTDLENGLFSDFVKVYAFDALGNVDSCDLFIEVRDNSNELCGATQSNGFTVSGFITTEDRADFDQVIATLMDGEIILEAETTEDGYYEFNNLKEGSNPTIGFERYTSYDDGISTVDLVLIQRHLLAIKDLDNPYSAIAADVNNNGSVSAIDLVELRRLILGIDTLLNTNGQESWRFVDVNQKFENISRPFPYTDGLMLQNIDSDHDHMDFMAVKIGDVNGSNSINSRVKSFSRNGNVSIDVINEAQGVSFYPNNGDDLSGLQLAFDFEDGASYHIEGGSLDIHADMYYSNEGKLIFSYVAPNGSVSVDTETPLFTIYKSGGSVHVEDVLLAQAIKKSEWINTEDRVHEIILNVATSEVVSESNLFDQVSNRPNPFISFTQLNINLNQPAIVDCAIYNQHGQVIFIDQYDLGKGRHTISLETATFDPGIYFLQLSNKEERVVHKLVKAE